MISTGEVSGDLHGAALTEVLRSISSDVRIYGLGGEKMRRAGADVWEDITQTSTVGLTESLRYYGRLRRVGFETLRRMERELPDVLVLIDTQGFNMAFAREVRRRDLPISIVYYFPPQAWHIRFYGPRVVRQVVQCVDLVISTLPMEYPVYRDAGANVRYWGHPFVDTVRASSPRDEVLSRVGLSCGRFTVGLMPGSREHEVDRLLPIMLEAAAIIDEKLPGTQFVALAASDYFYNKILRSKGRDRRVEVLKNDYDIMAACDLLILASGTATLEAAVLGVPMVIIYRTSGLTFAVGRALVATPFIGLPNIVAGRRIVPELIQGEASPQNLGEEAVDILRNEERRAFIIRELQVVKERLGMKGIVERVAREILNAAESGLGGMRWKL
ncbi:MAG: lipid-A-disaccharide synthase [bacterium]